MCNVADDVREYLGIVLDSVPDCYKREPGWGNAKQWLESLPTMPQPDWSQAPEWAEYATISPRGMLWWHSDEPRIDGTVWDRGNDQDKARYHGDVVLPLGTDWRLTLQRRPSDV